MSKTTRIGVANLPGLEDVLAEAGYHVISGQRFRDAALNIKKAMTSQAPPSVVLVGDFNQVGLKAWAEKLSQETTLRAITTSSGGAFADHPTVNTVSAPTDVWDVLDSLGIDTPNSSSPVIDSNGIAQVVEVGTSTRMQAMNGANALGDDAPHMAHGGVPYGTRTQSDPTPTVEAPSRQDATPQPPTDPWSNPSGQVSQVEPHRRPTTEAEPTAHAGPDPWGRNEPVAQERTEPSPQSTQQSTPEPPARQQFAPINQGGPAGVGQAVGQPAAEPGPPWDTAESSADPVPTQPQAGQPVQRQSPVGPAMGQLPTHQGQRESTQPSEQEQSSRSNDVRYDDYPAPPPPQQPPQAIPAYEANPPTQPMPRLQEGQQNFQQGDHPQPRPQAPTHHQPPVQQYQQLNIPGHQQQAPPTVPNSGGEWWPSAGQQAAVSQPMGQWASPAPPPEVPVPAQQPTWATQPSAPSSSRMPNQWSSDENYQATSQGLDQFGDVFDQAISDYSPDYAPGRTPFSDVFASVLIIGAGKGGVGKTSLSIATAQRAALAGYKVILIDSNRGQAGTGIRLRLRKSNLPTIADAAHSGNMADALVTPKQINQVRSGANLEEIKFGVIQAPPPSQASRRLVTNELYAKAIAFAKQKADLVIIDTQIAEAMAAADDTIYREVLVPTLRANDPNSPTAMLMLTEHGRESYNHLGDRVLELHKAGVQRNRVMMLLNTAPPEQPMTNLKQLGFDDYGEWVGVVDYDPRLMQTFNSGRTGAELDGLSSVLDHLLFRVTNDNEAFPSAPAGLDGARRVAAVPTRRGNREQEAQKKNRKGFFARLFSRRRDDD